MLIAIGLLIWYLLALIVAGHGAVPMAVLLVMGVMYGADAWFFPGIIAGWVGVIGLICATFRFRADPPRRLTYQFISSTLLYLSWLAIAILGNDESGSLLSSFILSAPFQATFFSVACLFWLQHRRGVQIPIV